MPVPKKKQSKTRGDKRAANWKASAPAYSDCPQCHQPKLPHRVCPNASSAVEARDSSLVRFAPVGDSHAAVREANTRAI